MKVFDFDKHIHGWAPRDHPGFESRLLYNRDGIRYIYSAIYRPPVDPRVYVPQPIEIPLN